MVIFDSFENGFYRWNNEGEMTVPNFWSPDWEQGSDQKRPEYKPDPTPEHVYDGSVSAKMTHRHVKFDGFLYRVFDDIVPGSRVDVEVMFKAFSEPKGGLAGRVGIHPSGGTNFSDGVYWGDFWGQYQDDWSNSTWHKLTASAIAQSNKVTVFLEARQDWGVNVTAAHWDALTFLGAGGDVPEPPPPTGGGADIEEIRQVVHEENTELLRNVRDMVVSFIEGGKDAIT